MGTGRQEGLETDSALELLDEHHRQFFSSKPFADRTGHPVPSDTRAWSQILVSTLTRIPGLYRKKGADLSDGSDVKAANLWSAIDTPRFNNCIPAGRTSDRARRPPDISALDDTPHIFFVLWDEMDDGRSPRCRVWCVRPQKDPVFRAVCAKWYAQYAAGGTSNNFQLHPPRYKDHNVIRNKCGNMEFPLLFCAVRRSGRFEVVEHHPHVLSRGKCRLVAD